MNFTEALEQAAREYGLSLTPKQLSDFTVYYELLIEWNEKMNLTAITDPQEVAIKHVVDSLSCMDTEFLPENCTLIDVGTGAGFPGFPIKIMRPDIRLTLLDSLNKRVSFLKEVGSRLDIQDVNYIHGRAEEVARTKEHREKYQVSSARAVARLNILCELCIPFLSLNGCFIAPKGAQYQEELNEAKNALSILGAKAVKVAPVKLPVIEDIRAVIYIQKTKPTPQAYPRRPGIPEKKPL